MLSTWHQLLPWLTVAGPPCWAVLLLLLLLVDVVVVVADVSEIKPGAVCVCVSPGCRLIMARKKLRFTVCSGIIARDACLDADVYCSKDFSFLWSTYSNAAFQALQSLPFCRRWHSVDCALWVEQVRVANLNSPTQAWVVTFEDVVSSSAPDHHEHRGDLDRQNAGQATGASRTPPVAEAASRLCDPLIAMVMRISCSAPTISWDGSNVRPSRHRTTSVTVSSCRQMFFPTRMRRKKWFAIFQSFKVTFHYTGLGLRY